MTDFDVVIVGAGMAGLSLACALAQSGHNAARQKLRIAVIESKKLDAALPALFESVESFDCRVSAITTGSQQFLEQLDVWPSIVAKRVNAFCDMHVWDGEGTASIHFSAREVSAENLGYIVENRVIISALVEKLQSHENVDFLDGLTVESIEHTHDCQTLHLALLGAEASGQAAKTLSSKLLVAADGAQSTIRALAGFDLRSWDYGHDAIVCTVELEQSHEYTAWQRFTSTGPLAFLPLASSKNQYCSIVWSQERSCAEQLMQLPDDAFSKALSKAFENRLGAIRAVSKRACFPLIQRHSKHYVRPGVALIADAAHTIHPLAGQGINLGFADVAVLADCLFQAFSRGQSIADMAVLKKFQRKRKAKNLMMMAAVEGFKQLYEQDNLHLHWLRNVGMRTLNTQAFVKREVIKQAMGV